MMKTTTAAAAVENTDGRQVSIGLTVTPEAADRFSITLAGTMIDDGRDDVESMGLDTAPAGGIVLHAIRCGRTWTVKQDNGRTVTEGVSRRDAVRYAAAIIADDVMLDYTDYYPV